jgi:hypothetical protein
VIYTRLVSSAQVEPKLTATLALRLTIKEHVQAKLGETGCSQDSPVMQSHSLV